MKDLTKRKGFIVINREKFYEPPNQKSLQALYSVFYPIAIEVENEIGFYKTLRLYGYSQYFREVENEEEIPQYEINLIEENNKIKVEEINEV